MIPSRPDRPRAAPGRLPDRIHGQDPGVHLYVVRITASGGHRAALEGLGADALSDDLFLLRSGESQSRVYHRVKRATGAGSLFVGRLAERPKFMGMEPGSLARLRKGQAHLDGDAAT